VKYAFDPITKEKFFLKGTRLDALKGNPEPVDFTTQILMDQGKLRDEIARARERSLALESRTAAFINSTNEPSLLPESLLLA
jgi:hypothetical protein